MIIMVYTIMIEQVWCRAVELARTRVQSRYVEVSHEVATRLAECGAYSQAADLLRDALQLDEAVEIAIKVSVNVIQR